MLSGYRNIQLLHLIAAVMLLLLPVLGPADDQSPGAYKGMTLRPCPESPNCVSSLSTDSRHRIAPLRFGGDPDKAMAGLAAILRGMPRSTIISQGADLLTVEFRTFLGFVDDAEFLLVREQGIIHVRSASRTGYWDLGVNRKRIEEIRERLGSAP